MKPTPFYSLTGRLRTLSQNTLFMNALYLMLSTFVVAVSGFLFWVVVARGYDVATVGLATTLLSVSGLLSLLGLAGFDTTFVRFLPRSDRKNEYISSGLIIVTLLSVGLAVGLAVTLPLISPSLSVMGSGGAFLSFIFFTVVTALNSLTNAVFLSYKRAGYIFFINTLFSAFKVILPLLITNGDAMTIFGLAGSAQLVGLVLSLVWMKRRFGYAFSPKLDMATLRTVKKFSFSVYASSILNLLPPTLLPLIIVYRMSPEYAAYYYMAFTIASALYVIAYATTQSVFAEGSHDEAAIRNHVAQAAKLIVILLLPAIVMIVALSAWLLSIFGHNYAVEANVLLRIFALSAVPVAVYSALGVIFKVTKNLAGIVGMNVVYAGTILGFSYFLTPRLGLIAVGWGWAIGNLVACVIGAWFLIKNNKKGERYGTTTHTRR